MHDLRAIRDNPEEFDHGLARRGLQPQSEDILAIDRAWRAAETRVQEAQAIINQVSRDIGAAKKSGADVSDLLKTANASKGLEADEAAEAAHLRRQLDELLASLPNLPADDVPVGPDETANRLIRTFGEPPRFNFPALAHEIIGEKLGMMDFTR